MQHAIKLTANKIPCSYNAFNTKLQIEPEG